MNFLPKYRPPKDIHATYLFCLLLSDCKSVTLSDTTFIVSCYCLDELEDEIGEFVNVSETLKMLTASEMIKIRNKDEYFLGVKVGKTRHLYANRSETTVLDYLRPNLLKYISLAPKKEDYLNSLWDELSFMKETAKNLTKENLMRAYEIVYTIVFQEPLRQFQTKEISQMSNLLRVYPPDECFQLIVYYLPNSERFKYAASIGTLLLKKDEISSALKDYKKAHSPKSYKRNDEF